MKVLLSLLRDFIDLNQSPEEISKTLTSLGLEVDAVEEVEGSKGDSLITLSLTPNLGHCASLLGVARELAAAGESKVKLPEVNLKEELSEPVSKAVTVEVKDSEKCPIYSCRIIKGVKIGPSPSWLQQRLEQSGVRSVNNVVDVTNYVMLELGHPLHAFDYDKIASHKIIVRHGKDGELFTTLDGKERRLTEHDLLICDGNGPIAIGGVMGGADSEVKDQTTNLLLEAAYFSPTTIRKTSKRLGLMTDASKRFERGVDPNMLQYALDRAAALIQQVAGGKVASGIASFAHKPFPKRKVACRVSRINHLLGTHLSASEIELIFSKLDMNSSWDGQDKFTVEVPTYRNDINEEIDLVEEVARIYGYENIDKSSGRCTTSTLPHAPMFIFEREIRTRLLSEGLQEFLTCDLIGPTLLETLQVAELPEKAWVKVLNPVSIEQSILRTSLLPGLLQVVKYNWDHQNHDIAGFEVGRIHFKDGEQFREQSMAGIILSGKISPHHWDAKPNDADFYDLKGIIENLINELHVPELTFRESFNPLLHPGRQASIYSGELEIGMLGEVHPTIQRRLDVPQRILFAELDLHDLWQVKSKQTLMHSLPAFPGSERDLTITVKEEIPVDQLIKKFRGVNSPVLESITLLDIYRSDKLGRGLKNVTFRFYYRDWEKTISQEKVDAEHARITTSINDI